MRKISNNGLNEQQKSGRQLINQKSLQGDNSPHYVYLCSEDEQSEEEENYQLQERGKTKFPSKKIEVINVEVQSQDTLQALSVRYCCTISELKRINNIHKDNEIFARRYIKIPVQPYSILTESVSNIKSNIDVSESIETYKAKRENEIINLLSTPSTLTNPGININNIILNSTVETITQDEESPENSIENLESEQLITSSDSVQINNSVISTFKCSGADWGLSWFQLVCFSLILGFAGPIIYIFYIAESPPKHLDVTEHN